MLLLPLPLPVFPAAAALARLASVSCGCCCCFAVSLSEESRLRLPSLEEEEDGRSQSPCCPSTRSCWRYSFLTRSWSHSSWTRRRSSCSRCRSAWEAATRSGGREDGCFLVWGSVEVSRMKGCSCWRWRDNSALSCSWSRSPEINLSKTHIPFIRSTLPTLVNFGVSLPKLCLKVLNFFQEFRLFLGEFRAFLIQSMLPLGLQTLAGLVLLFLHAAQLFLQIVHLFFQISNLFLISQFFN